MRTCAIYVRTYVHTYARTYVGAGWGGGGIRRRGNRRGKGGGGERPRRPQDSHDIDKVGWTPLMHAVNASTYCWRAARAVRSLALAVTPEGQRLSNVNAVATGSLLSGRTALHMACESMFGRGTREQLYVVNALLDAGARTDAETPDGHTPLSCAEAGGFTEVSTLLIDRGAKRKRLVSSAMDMGMRQ